MKGILLRRSNPVSLLIFLLIFGAGIGLALAFGGGALNPTTLGTGIVAFILAMVVFRAVNIADQWEKAVVLRLGKFRNLNGPGMFLIIPIIETIPYWIDTRVITASFKAEKTLTKDTVPVDVDAVLFWRGTGRTESGTECRRLQGRHRLGLHKQRFATSSEKLSLSEMLEGRDKLGAELQRIIDERTEPWGIHVNSVEVKDVLIPGGLENAMSMQAQARTGT